MPTPTPSALLAGFITNGTKGAVSNSGGALQSHDYVSNDTKGQIETAGYFNLMPNIKKGDTIKVTGGISGTPFITSYVVAAAPTGGDVTLTENAAVVQNSTQEITLNKISTKASDGEVFRYVANSPGKISKLRSVLNAALAGANATLTAAINGTPVTNGVLTLTQSGSAAGNVAVATPTAANTFAVGDVITVTCAGGSTATATANVSITLTP